MRRGRPRWFRCGRARPGLATYTAVLIADTATPAWKEAGGTITAAFAAGALGERRRRGPVRPACGVRSRPAAGCFAAPAELRCGRADGESGGFAGETFKQGGREAWREAAEACLAAAAFCGGDTAFTASAAQSPAPRCWRGHAASASRSSRRVRLPRATRSTPWSRSANVSKPARLSRLLAKS